MNQITIRQPHHDEFNVWPEIYKRYLDFYHTSLTEDDLQTVWSWLSAPSSNKLHYYFAEVDKIVMGLAHFREYLLPMRASSGIYLDDLIVLPQFSGQGIGCKLIEAIKRYCFRLGLGCAQKIAYYCETRRQKTMLL